MSDCDQDVDESRRWGRLLAPPPVGFCAWPSHVQNRGGQGRNRTSDTRIFSPLLYQLSYLAGPVRPGSECGKGARIIRGISPLAKNTRRWLQSRRFTDSKDNESRASATRRGQRIARRCGVRKGGRGHDSPARRQQLRANSLGFVGNPNAVVTCFRHYDQADDETHRRYHNGVDQGIAHASGGKKRGRGDERHQAPAPPVADVVGHGNRRVADPAWKILCQERPDRAVHHADVGHQDEYDEDGGRIVDCAGVGDFTQPCIQRVIRHRCQQHSPENDRLAADVVGEPSEQNQRRGGDEQRHADNVAGGQHVELFHRLQEVEGPELAAVPHDALPEQNHDSNQDEFDVGAQECLSPRVSYHPALGLHLLENRSFPQLQPDVDRHHHQQERDEERNPPAPCVELVISQVGPGTNDHREGNHDPERRRGLQPAGVVSPALVRNVLGNVGDRAAVFPAQAQPLDDSQAEQNKGSGNANRGVGGYQTDGGGPQAHSAQSHDKGVFAAHPVTQISEQKGAQWANQEAGGKQRDRAQQRRHRVGFVEELDRQDRGQTTEDVEVVPFNDVAYGGGDHYTTEVLWDLPGHSIPPLIRLGYLGLWYVIQTAAREK